MRKEDFFEVLGELDDDIVKGAKITMKKKMNWKAWGAMAACLCLIVAGTTALLQQDSSTIANSGSGISPVMYSILNILYWVPSFIVVL